MDFFGNILGQGKNVNPAIQQGTAQFEAGNYGEAVKSFEKALKVDPENGPIRRAMGEALACLGRDDEAVDWLRKALESSPGDAGILRTLGHALSRTGNYEEAAGCFATVMAREIPGDRRDKPPISVQTSRIGSNCDLPTGP